MRSSSAAACRPSRGAVIRIDPVATSIASVRRRPVWMIAYGEGALWAITGYELDTIERIDPESNAAVATIPLERVGEWHGYRPRIAVGEGAIWVAFRHSLWRISPATNRFVGSVPVGIDAAGSVPVGQTEGSVAAGYGALWIMGFGDGVLRRVDPVSQTVAKTIPLGTLIYPADKTQSRSARERSGLRSRRSLRDDRRPCASQVTATVERRALTGAGLGYEIALRTTLAPPYFVRLLQP